MIWRSELLSQFTELTHGSTSKTFGVLRYGSGTPKNEVQQNRYALLEAIGAAPSHSFLVDQVHGNDIILVKSEMRGNALEENGDLEKADALISDIPGVTLITRSADCVPVIFYHPEKRVAAVAHAGWQGTSKKVAQEVVKAMKSEYNCEPAGLFCAIGPSICGQDYDISRVDDDRLKLFERLYKNDSEVILRKDGKISLNLPLANKIQLLDEGIPEDQIEMSKICTFEDNEWPSYRRSADEIAYSIWSFIRVNNSEMV